MKGLTIQIIFAIFTLSKAQEDLLDRRPNRTPRIVNGRETKISEVPYQAEIIHKEKIYCGGAIVNRVTIITAAHCFKTAEMTLKPQDFLVRVGSSYIDKGGVVTKVEVIILHPDYDPKKMESFTNDVALFKLNQSLVYDEYVQPIQIAEERVPELNPGDRALISGWGKMDEDENAFPLELRSAYVVLRPLSNCINLWPDLTKAHLCAGYGFSDACIGDSGGPLVTNGYLIGLISFGSECAKEGFPSVYTRISSMKPFIDEHL